MNKKETKFKETEIGEIPEDWDILMMKDVGRVITGKTPPTKIKEYFGSDFPFIKIPDMGKSVYIEKSETMLSKKGAEYMGKLKLPKDSVMVSCLATIGKVGITKKESFTNQQINSLICDTKKVYPLWVYYFLKNNVLYLENLGGGGSVYTNISKSKFENAIIPTPTTDEQKEIIKILFDLDAKIELNQEMNKTLETTGQNLFKRWFVDFEFPNEKGEPYKSSGGEMVKSELGEIPKDWKDGQIGDLIMNQGGFAFKSSHFFDSGEIGIIKIKNVSGGVVDINSTQFVNKETVQNLDKKFKINPRSVLIAMTGAEVAKIGVVPNTQKDLWLNQRVGMFVEKTEGGLLFSYLLLTSSKYQELLKNKAYGSAQPNISSSDIESVKVLVPKAELLISFNNIFKPIFYKITENLYEMDYLTQIRDSLLPKLMTGKIRVPVGVRT